MLSEKIVGDEFYEHNNFSNGRTLRVFFRGIKKLRRSYSIEIAQHKTLNDFRFLGNVWTAKFLSDYIYQNYGERLCLQCIRDMLYKITLDLNVHKKNK